MSKWTIRPAEPADVHALFQLVLDLAEYEKLRDQTRLTEEGLRDALFGQPRFLEAIIAWRKASPVGFALYYHVFPSFTGKPGMYLEDLFVIPAERGEGIGKALLSTVARIACERGCSRLDWAVLDWNAPAISFYQSLGARPKTGWTIYQLQGEHLEAAAKHPAPFEEPPLDQDG
jgi:GNAT superfamily N-acetyltransferase